MATKKLIGQIGVDSGSLMIVDPCYLNDPDRWNIQKLKKIAEEHKAKNEIRMYKNTLRLAKEKEQLQTLIGDWDKYCGESTHEPQLYASGLIAHTNGDGGHNVYAYYDKNNRITKLEIVF